MSSITKITIACSLKKKKRKKKNVCRSYIQIASISTNVQRKKQPFKGLSGTFTQFDN